MILVTGRWISIKANTAFLTFVFSWSLLVSAADLKVMMLKDGSSPYAENAGGDVLSTFNRAVLGQLILSTSSYELEAGLLKSWKWNKKDGSYDLFLREGLTFHDGSPVKSDDLEFALLRGFFTKNRSFYQIYLGNILGVDSIKPGTPFSTGLISGVTITGSHSINIKLKNPNPSFLYSLTRPFFSFCKRSALNEDLMTWKKWPTGAGDYKIESEDDDKIILSKRFTSSKPSSNKIILYKKIKSDVQFDISFFPLDQKMDLFKTENPSAIFTLFFTNQNELSKNVNFRKAIKYGVNRKELVDGDILLRPAYEFLSSSFWKNDNSIIVQTDLNKAIEYFSKVPDALKAKTWRIPVFSFGQLSESKKKITSNLKKQFLTFGFKVDFYPSTEKFLAKETAMESPMAWPRKQPMNRSKSDGSEGFDMTAIERMKWARS